MKKIKYGDLTNCLANSFNKLGWFCKVLETCVMHVTCMHHP